MLNTTQINEIKEYIRFLFDTTQSERLKPTYISSSILHTFFSMHQDDLDSITKDIKQSFFKARIRSATIAKKIDDLAPPRVVNMADIMSFLKKYQAIQQRPDLLQLEEYLTSKKKEIIYSEGIKVKQAIEKKEEEDYLATAIKTKNQLSKESRSKEPYSPDLPDDYTIFSWYCVIINSEIRLASSPSKLDPENTLGKGRDYIAKPLYMHTQENTQQLVVKTRREHKPEEAEINQEKKSRDIISKHPKLFNQTIITSTDTSKQKQRKLEPRLVPLGDIFSYTQPRRRLGLYKGYFVERFILSLQNNQHLRYHTSLGVVSLFIKCMRKHIFISDVKLDNFGLTSDGEVISYDTPPMQVNLQDQLPERTWDKTPGYLNPVLEEEGYTYAAEMLSQLLTLLWYGTGYRSLDLTPFTLLSKISNLSIGDPPSLRVHLDQNQQEKSDYEGILGIKMFMNLIFGIQEFADLISTELSITDLHDLIHGAQCNNYVASFDVYKIINTIVTGIDSSNILSCMQKMHSHLAKQLRQITQDTQDNREQESLLEPQQRSSHDSFGGETKVEPPKQRISRDFFEDDKQSILGYFSCLNCCKPKRPEPREEHKDRSHNRYTRMSNSAN